MSEIVHFRARRGTLWYSRVSIDGSRGAMPIDFQAKGGYTDGHGTMTIYIAFPTFKAQEVETTSLVVRARYGCAVHICANLKAEVQNGMKLSTEIKKPAGFHKSGKKSICRAWLVLWLVLHNRNSNSTNGETTSVSCMLHLLTPRRRPPAVVHSRLRVTVAHPHPLGNMAEVTVPPPPPDSPSAPRRSSRGSWQTRRSAQRKGLGCTQRK